MSSSRRMFSAWARTTLSISLLTPCAAPAASVMSLPSSSKNLPVVCVMHAPLKTASSLNYGVLRLPDQAPDPGRHAALTAWGLAVKGPQPSADSLGPHAAFRYPLPRHRSDCVRDRAARRSLVRPRLHGRHPARLALWALSPLTPRFVERQAAAHHKPGRRFSAVDHPRHRARRQAWLRSVLRAELFLGQPARNSRGVERWHVLPRWTARRRHRRLFLLPRQGHQPSVARRYRLGGDAFRAVLRPHRQLHQFRGGWARERRALGHGVSRRRRRAAPSEPAL